MELKLAGDPAGPCWRPGRARVRCSCPDGPLTTVRSRSGRRRRRAVLLVTHGVGVSKPSCSYNGPVTPTWTRTALSWVCGTEHGTGPFPADTAPGDLWLPLILYAKVFSRQSRAMFLHFRAFCWGRHCSTWTLSSVPGTRGVRGLRQRTRGGQGQGYSCECTSPSSFLYYYSLITVLVVCITAGSLLLPTPKVVTGFIGT